MSNFEHEFYTDEDFNMDEVMSDNVLFNMVVFGGLKICKRCGQGEGRLDPYCPKAKYPSVVLRINKAVGVLK